MERRPGFTVSWEEGVTLIEVLVVASIILVLGLVISSNLPGARQQSAVGVCVSNLRNIATALEQYHAATGSYPTGSNADVNAALLQNPAVATVSYLSGTPIDPADPTQNAKYKYTYTAATSTVGEYYSITCPGLHPKETLQSIPGGASESTGTMTFDSRTQQVSAN